MYNVSYNILSYTFPVQYNKRSSTISLLPFLEEEIDRVYYKKKRNIDNAKRDLYKQLFVKHTDYKIEEEWRIISNKNRIEFPIISAVYMGYNIKKYNEQRLINICKRKNIPIYKQQRNPITHKIETKEIT